MQMVFSLICNMAFDLSKLEIVFLVVIRAFFLVTQAPLYMRTPLLSLALTLG